MSDRYEDLFEIVSNIIYSNVYNYSKVNLKNNILLTPLNNGIKVCGTFYSPTLVTDTPDNISHWILFNVPSDYLSNLLDYANTWLDFEHILNTYRVSVDLITASKRQVPSRLAFCRSDKSGRVIIAVNAAVYLKYGELSPETNMVIHFDSDIPNDRSLVSHIPIININMAQVISRFYATPAHQRVLLVNGYHYDGNICPINADYANDYYELYIDENIVFKTEYDLTERVTYRSDEEALHKDLIILPFADTSNHTYTYDTITISVHDTAGRGVYLPYLASMSVSSVTHRSIGISSYLIDAALDYLGASSGKLSIRVSNYSKNNSHTANGSLTEKMLNTDMFVLDALTNSLTAAVPYWGASRLEEGAYAKVLTEFQPYEDFSTDGVRKQIECLGYYSFTNALCKSTGEIQTTGEPIIHLTIPVPPFWESTAVYPILYLDKAKIPHSRYTVTRDGQSVSVVFDVPIEPLNAQSVVTYQLILNEKRSTYTITPSDTEHMLLVPKGNSNVSIFVKSTMAVKTVNGSLAGYTRLTAADPKFVYTEADGNAILNFNMVGYYKDYAVVLSDQTVFTILPNYDLNSGSTIAVIPGTVSVTDDSEINVLIPNTYEVYLNGKFLVPNLEYSLHEIKEGEYLGGYQLVLQSLSKLNDTTPNLVEVYQTNQNILKTDSGYVIDNVINKNVNNEAYIPGLSRLFINGNLVPNSKITEFNTHYLIDPTWCSQGNTYHFILGISTDFYKAYQDYLDPEYFVGRSQINDYFMTGYTRTYSNPIVVDYTTKLYSAYLNEIIRRIKSGEITVNYINDDADILNQLVAYEYLKEFDVLFNHSRNERFVDMYPSFLASQTIDDLNKYRYIQRLVKIHLGDDANTDSNIIFTGN